MACLYGRFIKRRTLVSLTTISRWLTNCVGLGEPTGPRHSLALIVLYLSALVGLESLMHSPRTFEPFGAPNTLGISSSMTRRCTGDLQRVAAVGTSECGAQSIMDLLTGTTSDPEYFWQPPYMSASDRWGIKPSDACMTTGSIGRRTMTNRHSSSLVATLPARASSLCLRGALATSRVTGSGR